MTQQETEALAPLRLSVLVGRPPAHAFRVFTEGIGTWWPLETHSVGEGGAENVELESRVGGQIVERLTPRASARAAWRPQRPRGAPTVRQMISARRCCFRYFRAAL